MAIILPQQGAPGVSPAIEAFAVKYGWIVIGLTCGLAAKYALLMKKGVKIRGYLLLADLLLLPMVALIAYWLIGRMGIEGEAAALVASAATVGADRIVKLVTDRFVRQVDVMIADEATRRKQQIREEVQAELSAQRTLQDIATGKRPIGGE
ncbi:hypothetical protein HHL26_06760 [Sphingobium sp. TB-6]|nr:hypothetical protein [Sphingobium sp. TB-6]